MQVAVSGSQRPSDSPQATQTSQTFAKSPLFLIEAKPRDIMCCHLLGVAESAMPVSILISFSLLGQQINKS